MEFVEWWVTINFSIIVCAIPFFIWAMVKIIMNDYKMVMEDEKNG